jgi:hypothetical protein
MFNFIVFVIVALIALGVMIAAGGWSSVIAITVLVVIALIVGAIGLTLALAVLAGQADQTRDDELTEKKKLDSEKADANFSWYIDWDDIRGERIEIDSYYLADEGVIRLCVDLHTWYGEVDQIERPAANEVEAKAIFDFYVFKIILEKNCETGTGPKIDPDSYSVLYQFDSTYFGQWFPLKGFIRLEMDNREAREWPAKTLYEADTVFQAYVWELDRTADVGSVLLQWWRWCDESELFGCDDDDVIEDENYSHRYIDDVIKAAGKDGSISFDGGDGYTGIYSGNVIKLSAPPDIEKTVTVKNPMEAILVFKDFSL